MKIKFRADNQLNLDYLRYLFKAHPGEEIKITLTNDFGRMAVSLYTPQEKRDARPDDELTVRLRLPRHNIIAGTTRRIHYTDAMQKRLNMILSTRLNIELDTYYAQGVAMGIPQQEIIESFVVSRGLVSVDNIEALTKRIYRNTITAVKKKTDALLAKARYNQSKIEPPPTKK